MARVIRELNERLGTVNVGIDVATNADGCISKIYLIAFKSGYRPSEISRTNLAKTVDEAIENGYVFRREQAEGI
jgi:hypothetical protein